MPPSEIPPTVVDEFATTLHDEASGTARRSGAMENVERDVERQGAVLPSESDGPAREHRYETGELIGEGGMGAVRLEQDRMIGRSVARKTLHPEHVSDEARRRFMREARVQGQLEHPSIVPVYDIEIAADGAPSFTMRRIHGLTLADVITGLKKREPAICERFSRRKLLTALSNVCLALHYAHRRGVVHRDLKPANVMLGAFGEVYVLDWGLAKIIGAPEGETDPLAASIDTTQQGVVMGSVGYMAPEHVQARNLFDARTDVYGLGLIAYEIVALQPLFDASLRLHQFVAQMASGADARPSRHVEGVPPELDAICVKATAKNPADRYASARELADAIDAYLDGDRDEQRRQDLARKELAAATAATERALAPATAPEDASTAREEALHHSLHALALDPKQAAARSALVRLFVDLPERLPAEAEKEFALAQLRSRREGARFAWWSYASWVAAGPAVLLLGVRHWGVVIATFVLSVLAAGLARVAVHRGLTGARPFAALAVLNAACTACMSCWLGPFVLVPTAAAVSTTVFMMHAERRERAYLVALGVLAVVVPYVLEALGVLGPSWSFVHDRIVFLPRAFGFPHGLTVFALLYSSITFIALPALFLTRLRDALRTADREVFLRAWYVRRWMGTA